jgi:hypothetical protein
MMMMAAVSMSLFFVGCIGAEPSPEEEGDEDVTEAEQALPPAYYHTTYYSDASMTTIVGSCTSPSICTGSTTRCTGQVTAYYERLLIEC